MIVIITGVCGCGKTTVGQLLALKLGWQFADADDYHTDINKEKMSQCIPLTEEDRIPWLLNLHQLITRWKMEAASAVLACSALRKTYRQLLAYGSTCERPTSDTDVLFVQLCGSETILADRMKQRKGHFMPFELLQSQLATLEEPSACENVLVIDVSLPVSGVVHIIERRLMSLRTPSAASHLSEQSQLI